MPRYILETRLQEDGTTHIYYTDGIDVVDTDGTTVINTLPLPTEMVGYAIAVEERTVAVEAENTHLARLSSDAAIDRLREIRDASIAYNQIASPTNAEIAARVKIMNQEHRDLAKWCLEASKWLANRKGEAEG